MKREKRGRRFIWENYTENFNNLGKETDIEFQESQKVSIKSNKSCPSPRHVIVKFTTYIGEKSWKQQGRKMSLTYREDRSRSQIYPQKLGGPERSGMICSMWRIGKNSANNTLFSKSVIQNERKGKECPKQKLKKFMTTKPILKEILKGVFEWGKKGPKITKTERNREYHQKHQLYR